MQKPECGSEYKAADRPSHEQHAFCEDCGADCGDWSIVEESMWRFSHTGRILCLYGKPSCYDIGTVLEEAFGMAEIDLADPMISVHYLR